MFRKGFFIWRVLAGLLMVAILVVGGMMIFRAGQAQGYALGAASVAAEGALPAPQTVAPVVPPYAPFWPAYYRPHFFPFGPLFGLFCFGGLIFFLFFAGGLFRFRAWNHHHGYREHGHWAGGPHWARRDQDEPEAGREKEPPKEPPATPPAGQ